MYQTLKTVFDRIFQHLEVCHKYPAACHIFNSFLSVCKCGQTQSFMFDVYELFCKKCLLFFHLRI